MVDAASALAAAKHVDEAVGLIARLVGKLRAQPDIAAVKLSLALTEVVKTYSVVDDAIAMYVSLAIDKDALTAKSQQLASLAGGALTTRVEEGRGRCSVIDRIYWEDLHRWFERALNRAEQVQMERAFERLGSADQDVFRTLADVADQLTSDTARLVDLAIQDRQDDARAHIKDTYRELRDVQGTMAEGIQRLYKLKDEFMDIAVAR